MFDQGAVYKKSFLSDYDIKGPGASSFFGTFCQPFHPFGVAEARISHRKSKFMLKKGKQNFIAFGEWFLKLIIKERKNLKDFD